MPLFAIEGLSVSYGETRVISDLDLTVQFGQMTIIVGPNGCGKSTLLKTMGRVLHPSAGTVRLRGTPVHTQPTRQIAREIALLPQGPVAPEGLTVHELVAQGRFPHQSLIRQWSREDARAVADAMKAAQVTEFANRRLSDLSGGQRQRCWIAMVIAQATSVLLLDEPTTFLDLKVQVDLMAMLRSIAHDANRTLVVVMHELNVAAAFADKLVMMKDGAVIVEGSVSDVFTHENLARVFDLDATILIDVESGRPVCVPKTSQPLSVAAQ